jgi:hypothetical protein
MAYVLATYYIGWSNQYDGSGNTDTAAIHLFHDKENAIQAAIKSIQETIDDQVSANVRTDLTFNDETNLKERLEKYAMYNFEDHYMFTLEHCLIE